MPHLFMSQKTKVFDTAHLQKCARITPEQRVRLPTATTVSALSFFVVFCEERTREVAWRDATRSHLIPRAVLATNGRRFQIASTQTLLRTLHGPPGPQQQRE